MPQHEKHVLDFVDAYLFDVLEPTEADYVESHCRRCRICKVALEEARKRQGALDGVPPCEASEQLLQATLDRIEDAGTRAVPKPRSRRWMVKVITSALAASLLLLGSTNLYYLNLRPSPYDLELLGQENLFADTDGSLRVRLLDQNNGQPVANVPVTISMKRGTETVQLCSFTTDGDGSGSPSFRVPDWADGRYELHVRAKTGWTSTENIQRPVQLKRSWKLMLSSDKPVYQPGQELRLRALALRQPDLKPVAGQSALFTISDPKENLIFKKQGTTSPYGITSADCPLASEVLEGPYTITCKIGDSESKLTVEVKKYVLPKFKIDLDLDQAYYQPGQRVKGTLRANYFFGKPVIDGEVELEAETTGSPPVTLHRGKVRTNDKGDAEFAFTLPNKLPGTEQERGDARFTLKATVIDSASQKQTRTASRIVTALPLRIDLIPESGTLVQGVTNTVYIYTSYPDGRPARTKLRVGRPDGMRELETNTLGVAVVEITPEAATIGLAVEATDGEGKRARRHEQLTCGNPQDDYLVRTDKAVYDGGATVHLTVYAGGAQPVFVDFIKDGQTMLTQTVPVANGRGALVFDLPSHLFGSVELCTYRFARKGLPVRKTRLLYVRPAEQLQIKTTFDHEEYRPGTQARLRLALTDRQGKPTPGALSLAAVDEAVFSVLEQAPGMEKVFYTLEQNRMKPVFALYPWSPDLTTALPPRDVAQFEQALFSRTTYLDGSTSSNRGTIGYAGPLHSLNVNSYPAKVQETAFCRDQALEWMKYGWIAMALSLLFTGYIALWLVFPSEEVLRLHGIVVVGVLVVGAFVSLFLMPMLGTSANKTFSTVSNTIAASAAPGARSPEPVMDRERAKSKAPPQSGDQPAQPFVMQELTNPSLALESQTPVRVRQWFAETLLWQPELITDDKGEATINIELADSITTWRLTASAVSASGQLGAMQRPLKVFQPFFVDLNLPVTLTRGDEVGIPVVVYNYLDKPQTVELTFDKGDWFIALDEASQRIELQPGEVRSTTYRLRVAKVGKHALQVTARASGVADAIKREIEVVPDGRKIEYVHSGTLLKTVDLALSLPQGAIEGSARAVLKIYPTNFSQVVEGLDAIFRMPSGCFEQTSSTTYPNVLALDYLKRTGKSVPAVEAKARQYIHLGYQKLLTFEVKDGGFDWFGRPPANRTLTAYGLMEFQDMARVHDVDPALIDRTRRWLLAQRKPDGSWPAERGMINDGLAGSVQRGGNPDLGTTAYIAWAVFSGASAGDNRPATEGWNTLQYLLHHAPESIDDSHVLGLVCNALLALDPSGREAGPYVDRLLSLSRTSSDGKRVWWEQSSSARTTFYGSGRAGAVETTALAILALTSTGQRPGAVQGALAWLAEQKDQAGTWHSTQATVLALKALVATTRKSVTDRERVLDVSLGDFKQELRIPADQADVMQLVDLTPHLKAGGQRLQLTERGETAPGYQVTFRYHVPGAVEHTPREPLTISIAYDRTKLQVGEQITARARVVNTMPQTAPMVMVDLPIPAGFAPVTDDFVTLQELGTIAKYQMTGRSVLVYLRGLDPKKPLTLTYKLRATMPVDVAVPPARVWEYYDTDKQGQSEATRMKAVP